MRGIIITCPNKDCRKMLMKNTYLRIGSYLTVKCFHCGVMVSINAEQGNIELRLQKTSEDISVDKSSLTDDDDDDTIFLSV